MNLVIVFDYGWLDDYEDIHVMNPWVWMTSVGKEFCVCVI